MLHITDNVLTKGEVSEEEIILAEGKLNMKFPMTYREIIKQYGVISAGSQEIFGLGVKGNLNVVKATLEERELAKGLLDKYIVIQNIGGANLLIVVDAEDNVFEYSMGKFKNLLSSTEEYIQSEVLDK